jgi:hypothetical protein
MEIDINGAYERYETLTDEEKNIIREVMNGPAKAVIEKLFGSSLVTALGTFAAPTPTPKKRTMAPTMPQQQPQAKPQGLAARPQR